MALSNKKIKYIKNTIGQKSAKDLAAELNVTENEVLEILKGFSQSEINSGIKIAQSNSNINYLSEHSILIYFQALLVFIAPLISMNSEWYDFANLAQGLYIQSIAGFMVLFWLFDCLISKQFEIKKNILYLPILCVLIWSGLSMIWATNISESLEIFSLWVACATIFFVLYNMVKNSFDFSVILTSIICSMGYLILIGMIQFFDPTFNWYNQVISPSGTFGNKNMFCDYLIIVLPICFYFFFKGSDKTRIVLRIISATMFIGAILLIVFSLTRAGMLTAPIIIGLFIGFLTLIYLKNRSYSELFSKQKIILAGFFLGLFVILLTVYILNDKKGGQGEALGKRIKSIFVLPDQDKIAFEKSRKDEKLQPVSDSTTIRLITWANTLKMIQDKPLHGFGLYNWQIHYGEYRRAVYNDPTYMPGLMLAQLHNDYLQILADLGLIGFLLFAWLVICVFVLFFKIFFSTDTNLETKLKALSLFLCVISFGIICNFSFLIVKSVPTLLLFIYFALISNLYYYWKQAKSSTPLVITIPTKMAGLLLIPVLCTSIGITAVEVNRGAADKLFKTAMDSHKQQKYDIVIKTCNDILDRDPLHYKTHFVIANAYMSQDNYEKAKYHIEKGLKYYPNDLYALFQAGTIYIKHLKDVLEKPNPDKKLIKELEDKTLYWYGRAFAIREDFGKAWNNLGYLYERRASRLFQEGNKKEGDEMLKKSEECFDKSIAQDPYYTDALLNKANILQNTGRNLEVIPIANKVLKIAMDKYNEKDAALQKLIEAKFQQNTGKFNDAVTQKIIASQDYMAAAPKAIMMLKIEYDKAKNYQGFLEVLEYEKTYLVQQLEIRNITYLTAKKEYEMAKSNSAFLRAGVSLDQLEKNYLAQKQGFEQAEIECNQKMARLYIDMSDFNRLLGKTNLALDYLNKVLDMAKSLNYLLEQESIARVQINGIYLSNINQELVSKFPMIQENFDKATFKGNQDLTNHKQAYEQLFRDAKKMLNK